jgi:alpha-ketoglutarate-dependent taurine dioxygenase
LNDDAPDTTEEFQMDSVNAVDESALFGETCETWLMDRQMLPLFIRPRPGAMPDLAAALAWARQYRASLDKLIVKYAAIVLRGFPVATPAQFDQFIGVFPQFESGYIGGGAPRGTVVGSVMEATRAAPELFLGLHQEMAYLPKSPARLAFCCIKPAETGGETIICNMREFTRRMPAHIRERLETLGVHCVRNYDPAGSGQTVVKDARDGIAWDEAFGTTDRKVVEAACAERGLQPIWQQDGRLSVVTSLHPFCNHPVTGERIYRSNIHTNHVDTATGKLTHKVEGKLATGYTYGDGSPMNLEDSQALYDILTDLTLYWTWQASDIMIVDNLQISHGRNKYTGTRETVVALLN